MRNDYVENVIFLDIDGPIIPPKNAVLFDTIKELKEKDGKLHGFTADFANVAENTLHFHDPVAVILITHLAIETNSKIVISSTWRGSGYKYFSEDFEGFGFDRALLHEDWRTLPDDTMPRIDGIKEWLSRHPEVKKFVTIDDEILDFDEHVQVCAHNGFLYDNYNQAYELLTGEPTSCLSNISTIAFVDHVGPEHLIDDKPALARSIGRLAQRKEHIRAEYKDFNI